MTYSRLVLRVCSVAREEITRDPALLTSHRYNMIGRASQLRARIMARERDANFTFPRGCYGICEITAR